MGGKITLIQSDGLHIVGILNTVNADKNNIVILVHGFTSHKNTNSFKEILSLLAEATIDTFRIDLFGHGESEGEFEMLTVTKTVRNILTAVQWAYKFGYKNIGLLGSSFGGLASMIAASKTKKIKYLALKSPVSDLLGTTLFIEKLLTTKEKWEKDGVINIIDDGKLIKLNYLFLLDAQVNNGYEFAIKIKQPTMIVHGDADNEVPIIQSKKLSKIIDNSNLVIINKAGHGYHKLKDYRLMSKTFAERFIKKFETN